MQVTRVSTDRRCGVCERTLLLGERSVRFSPLGDSRFIDVCALCREQALDQGWVREGSPTIPRIPEVRRRSRYSLAGLLGVRQATVTPVADDPILRRLSRDELAIVEAADRLNSSHFRRGIEGIARSLGRPRVSIVPISGVHGEAMITIAWEISWYQYRVTPESPQPVKLENRGQEVSELTESYVAWNAELLEDGRVVPNIARV